MVYIEIDFASDEAIYQQVCNQIIMGIATSRILEGEVLPSVRQLAEEIGVNMHTVNKAYSLLRQEGFVRPDRRRGSVVSVAANREYALQSVKRDLYPVLAEARCRGLSREDLQILVDEIYEEYENLCQVVHETT